MLIRLEGGGPLHHRLCGGLRAAIQDGRLLRGARMPSTRWLARELRVSRNVVVDAYAQLCNDGYAEARGGSGTYVTTAARARDGVAPRTSTTSVPGDEPALSLRAREVLSLRPLPVPGQPRPHRLLYDFGYEQPALEQFPHVTWSRLLTRRARSMSTRTLAYGQVRGFGPLREAVCEYLRRVRGMCVAVDQLFIVNGALQAFDLVGRMLVDRGDRVVVEDPCYQAVRQVFLGLGANVVPVAVDRDGLDVAQLPQAGSARLACVSPSHQFPLGGVLSLERRRALLRWAEQRAAYVLEDDYECEFRYGAQPVEALQSLDRSDRVLYLGSFSKVLFPALRLGYLIVPAPLVPAAMALKYLASGSVPTFEQEVLADFICEGHFERHVRRMRALYTARRDALLEALRETFADRVEILGADAGLHLVIYPRGLAVDDVPALLQRAASAGVGIYSATPYYLERPARAGLLLGYASLSERDIRDGVRVLGAVIGAG